VLSCTQWDSPIGKTDRACPSRIRGRLIKGWGGTSGTCDKGRSSKGLAPHLPSPRSCGPSPWPALGPSGSREMAGN
jgi:hypothetical protein